MQNQSFNVFSAGQVTDAMIEEASELFSEHYGIWGKQATGKFTRPGSRVRLRPERLRSAYLPTELPACFYVRATVDGKLAGNAFACHWVVNGRTVCWVTQLVVHHDYRERGLAKGLLNQLKQPDVDMYGIMSSHPASCLAAAKAFGDSMRTLQLNPIKIYAADVMKASPIAYVRDAKPCGSLFDPGDTSGCISSVNTRFFVDHDEPLEALAWVREDMEWPLGELLEGHEFLVILEASRRSRSRSR